MNDPSDRARDAILRHLYQVHKRARSPKSAAIGIRDLAQALKLQGFKLQEVASNLDYLMQKGWVREVVDNRTFTTRAGTTQQAEKRCYKNSDAGIDLLESASTYQRSPTGQHLNIMNIQGVTVVGDGNVVNTTFADFFRMLHDIRAAASVSPMMDDRQKLDIVADIDGLQSQLQKPSPSGSVVRILWAGIEKAVTAAGFAELVAKAAGVIAPLLR